MRRILFGLVVLLLVPTPTRAAVGPQISIQDFSYSPQTYEGLTTGTPDWYNSGPSTHTVTSSFPGYLVSGPLDQFESFQKNQPIAGVFPYHCDFHPVMRGTYVVDMVATPGSPTVGDLLSVRVALGTTLPAGYVVDLQVRKPRADRFKTLYADTASSVNTVAMTRPGTWKFRARAQFDQGVDAVHSGWSRTLKVVVTA